MAAKRQRFRGVLASAAMAAAACSGGIHREYVWTRDTPAAGRKSPTTFVVRVSIDRASRSVVWAEDVSDREGDIGRSLTTRTGCAILDDSNWDCPGSFVAGKGDVDHASMRNGELAQAYWGEDRRFARRTNVLGTSF